MAKEIEGKFRVVRPKMPDLASVKHSLVEQLYVSLNEIGKVVIGEQGTNKFITYFLQVPGKVYLRLSKKQYEDLGGARVVRRSEEARIRKKGEKYTFTIKGDGTLARNEWETEISQEMYERLVLAAEGRKIVKYRYEIELPGGKTAEVDIYLENLAGPDHMTVEVEFGSDKEAKAFERPEWFGEDITSDKRFKNKNLAVKGWPATL